MKTRDLTPAEQVNFEALRRAGLPMALLFVTATGLGKSILDATFPMRTLLADAGVHHFESQAKGPTSKRFVDGQILLNDRAVDTVVSLYRPITKNGDPRMWPRNFSKFAWPNDVFSVFVAHGKLVFVNLSQSHVGESFRFSIRTNATEFINSLQNSNRRVAVELLDKLRALAACGPLPELGHGDTSVGFTIESALGIPRNSSQKPDYFGIELKAKRWTPQQRGNRYSLFACVPDWNLSPCKSSAEILAKYGCQRDADRRLYCTVSARDRNQQGLQFRVDDNLGRLVEFAWRESATKQSVAVWELEHLHQKFGAKHGETFWIHVAPVRVKGKNAFKLSKIIHTRGPSFPQFDRFLEEGIVTMDHLIKKTGTRVVEKGPLFKVTPARLLELFLGDPEIYQL